MTKMPTRLEKRAGSEFFSHRRFRVCSSSGKLFFVEPPLARDKDERQRFSVRKRVVTQKRWEILLFTSPSMSRKDALQIVTALYGATDVTQLNRLKYKRFKRVNEDTTIDEIYGTFDTTKERKKMEDSEKKRKEKNLRMKYGKRWKTILDTKNKKDTLRPGEVKRLVRGKWVSNKD